MKKTINKKVYNTDTAKEIDRIAFGTFGDPAGYEEIVYETKRGDRFLYGIGGADSKYPTETIIVIEEAPAAEKKPAAKKTTKK